MRIVIHLSGGSKNIYEKEPIIANRARGATSEAAKTVGASHTLYCTRSICILAFLYDDVRHVNFKEEETDY